MNPRMVLSPVLMSLFLFLPGAPIQAQGLPQTGSEPGAEAIDVAKLQIGEVYRLSMETFVVMEPEPELHTVPGVSAGGEHFPVPPPVPASTVVRISRKTAGEDSELWYELRSQDGEITYGWVSAYDLEFQELTRVE